MLPKLATGSKYEGANEVLRVPQLNCFHQCGNLRRLKTRSFSLRDGHRTAVRPRNQGDRKSYPVEPRYIGNPCDAELVFDRQYLLKCLNRQSGALRSLKKALGVTLGLFVHKLPSMASGESTIELLYAGRGCVSVTVSADLSGI